MIEEVKYCFNNSNSSGKSENWIQPHLTIVKNHNGTIQLLKVTLLVDTKCIRFCSKEDKNEINVIAKSKFHPRLLFQQMGIVIESWNNNWIYLANREKRNKFEEQYHLGIFSFALYSFLFLSFTIVESANVRTWDSVLFFRENQTE